MTISEACQIWIEQRIEEELQEQEKTGKSLRAIGREIAKEIERVFEAKVSPHTIDERARRMLATNVAPQATHQEHEESEEKPSAKRDRHGQFQQGTTPGPGRKPKYKKEVNKDEERLLTAYNQFVFEVSAAKTNQWRKVSKKRIVSLIENLITLIEE